LQFFLLLKAKKYLHK